MWLSNFDRMVQKCKMGAWKGKFGNLDMERNWWV